MIHYHCGDIYPRPKLLDLAGRHLMISHAYPWCVRTAHEIAQTVALDNGAFTVWRSGGVADWTGFYQWAEEWLACPTTWAIVPDVIDGTPEIQDALLAQWPHGRRGAPVWHLDEPIERALRLADEWPRFCLGSAGRYRIVGSPAWRRRMDDLFDALSVRHRWMPWTHGLRMQGVGHLYPFGSVDSADVARNNNRPQNTVRGLADRWDCVQPPFRWAPAPVQQEIPL